MHNINFVDSLVSYWQHWLNWNGRITRLEFWFAQLGMFLVFFILKAFNAPSIYSSLLFLANILPFIAATARRLHDIGKSAHTLWIVPLSLFLFFVCLALLFAVLDYMGLVFPVLQKIHSVIFVLGGYILVFIIPTIGLIAGFIPSQRKVNKYGAPKI